MTDLLIIALLIVGFVILMKRPDLRVMFFAWFGGLSLALLLVYFFLLTPEEFWQTTNFIGIEMMGFVLAMLCSFVQKWLQERQSA